MKKLLLALLMIALVAPAPAGAARQRDTVPWDQVGDGWVLATVERGAGGEAPPRARSLELISPEGTRYPLYATTKQPLKHHVDPSNFTLAGWDPEDRIALLERYVSLGRKQAIRLDLESGSSQSLLLPKQNMATGLRPDGAGVLSQSFDGKIFSITWDGTSSLLWDTGSQGDAIATLDGTGVVLESDDHVSVLPFDGSATREIATPGECNPLRWYSDTQLLTSCLSRKGSQLTAIGLDGSVTPLGGLRRTTSKDFRGPSWGDTDVRVAAGRSYYEGNGPCGGSFITRENATGKDKMVRVPGSTGGVSILDARSDRLLIAHTATCDGGAPRAVLSLFDPVSKDEDVLLTLARSEHWNQLAVWDEPRPWRFY